MTNYENKIHLAFRAVRKENYSRKEIKKSYGFRRECAFGYFTQKPMYMQQNLNKRKYARGIIALKL